MWQSLLLKLGMFAATLSVVFWIGWSVPTSLDRLHDSSAQLSEGSQSDNVSSRERDTEMSLAPVSFMTNQPSAAGPKRSQRDLLDLNRATDKDFDALPGIGPQLAERIVGYRQLVGAFHSPDELQEVKGIGKKKFERIRPLVTVMPDSRSGGRGKKGT